MATFTLPSWCGSNLTFCFNVTRDLIFSGLWSFKSGLSHLCKQSLTRHVSDSMWHEWEWSGQNSHGWLLFSYSTWPGESGPAVAVGIAKASCLLFCSLSWSGHVLLTTFFFFFLKQNPMHTLAIIITIKSGLMQWELVMQIMCATVSMWHFREHMRSQCSNVPVLCNYEWIHETHEFVNNCDS